MHLSPYVFFEHGLQGCPIIDVYPLQQAVSKTILSMNEKYSWNVFRVLYAIRRNDWFKQTVIQLSYNTQLFQEFLIKCLTYIHIKRCLDNKKNPRTMKNSFIKQMPVERLHSLSLFPLAFHIIWCNV